MQFRRDKESPSEKAKVYEWMRSSGLHPDKCSKTGHAEEQPPQEGTTEPPADAIRGKEKRGQQEEKGEGSFEVEPDHSR